MLTQDAEPQAPETGLRPAEESATRTRERLAATAEKGIVGGALIAGGARLRYLGSADAAARGRKYLPAVWLVLAIVAVAFYFPGRDSGSDAATQVAATPATAPVTPPTTAAAPTTTTTVAAAAPTPPPTFATAPAPTAPPTTAAVTPTTVAAASTTTVPPAPVPLRIDGWAWATSLGGSSVTPIPDDSLPVGNRIGSIDKVSFVRLTGTADLLTLEEHPDGSQESLGAAAVKACLIDTAGWDEGPGQSLDDAPTWSDTCVAGVESGTTWTFDVGALDTPDRVAGFALVPGDSAPADFQLAFRL